MFAEDNLRPFAILASRGSAAPTLSGYGFGVAVLCPPRDADLRRPFRPRLMNRTNLTNAVDMMRCRMQDHCVFGTKSAGLNALSQISSTVETKRQIMYVQQDVG